MIVAGRLASKSNTTRRPPARRDGDPPAQPDSAHDGHLTQVPDKTTRAALKRLSDLLNERQGDE